MMTILRMIAMILMVIMMTKPYDYDDDTDDDNDHKNDSYTAAGAAPGASVPCSLLLASRSLFLVLHLASTVSGSGIQYPAFGCRFQLPTSGFQLSASSFQLKASSPVQSGHVWISPEFLELH